MKYLGKRFSSPANSQTFVDNWDAIFSDKPGDVWCREHNHPPLGACVDWNSALATADCEPCPGCPVLKDPAPHAEAPEKGKGPDPVGPDPVDPSYGPQPCGCLECSALRAAFNRDC